MRTRPAAIALAGAILLFAIGSVPAFGDDPCASDPVCSTEGNVVISASYSAPATTSTPPAATPDDADPATPPASKPHGWTEFVPGSSCVHVLDSCGPLPPNICTSEIADYQRRLAADPSIPEEKWTAGQYVHYDADGHVQWMQPPTCENLAPTAPDPAPRPQVTDAVVLTAFKSMPLPVPQARMSPAFPACVHLNVPNYVYVDPIDTSPITVTLLGTPVTVYPRVLDYTWDFGDGHQLTTTDPGAAWPDGTIAHVWRHPGRYEVTVTVRWAADWQSPDHARSAVPGQTTTTSAPGVAWAHEVHVVLVNSPNAVLPTKPHDPADACYQH